MLKLKLKLICDRQSVGQFVWVSGLPMGPLTRFYLVLLFSADNYLIILPKASSKCVSIVIYILLVLGNDHYTNDTTTTVPGQQIFLTIIEEE
jgi:hypothetical protein